MKKSGKDSCRHCCLIFSLVSNLPMQALYRETGFGQINGNLPEADLH